MNYGSNPWDVLQTYVDRQDQIFSIGVPRWCKIDKSFLNLAAAGTTSSISLYTLPIKGVIHSVFVNPVVPFSGGSIASYTLSVGITGTNAKYLSATNVFTGATIASPSMTYGIESMTATATITVTATSTGGNLNTATQGSADIYILVSILP